MSAITPHKPKSGVKKRRKGVRSHRPAVPLAISDSGLEARYARGEVEVDHSAADPVNPRVTISRARVMPVYARLFSRGTIDEHQREAADRYAIQHERMSGARWLNGESVGVSAAFWDRLPASEAQMRAVESIRDVEVALGKRATMLMRLLIVEDMLVATIAERQGISAHVMMGEIKAALTRAVEFWNIAEDLSGPPSRIR